MKKSSSQKCLKIPRAVTLGAVCLQPGDVFRHFHFYGRRRIFAVRYNKSPEKKRRYRKQGLLSQKWPGFRGFMQGKGWQWREAYKRGSWHGKRYYELPYRFPSNLEELKQLLEIDTLPGTKEAQETFLKFAQQKLQEEGGREWLLQEKGGLLAQLADTERISDENLEKKARKARFNGFISLWDLADILEAEEDRDLLPILWKEFECNSSRREVEIDTPYKRTFGWYKLLARLTGIGSWPPEGVSDRYWADPVLGKLPRWPNYLNLYNHDPATGDLKIISIKDRDETGFIKLKDLEEYFTDIKQILEINLPLPKRLFPEAQEKEDVITAKTPQIGKEEFEKKPGFKEGGGLSPEAKQDQAQKEERKPESGVDEKTVEMEAEDFVRKLRVSYGNDSEIKIQLPGKPAVSYNHKVLGFRDSNGRVWKDLLLILENPDDPTYTTGPAYGDKKKLQRKKGYDVARKRLEAMNNKMLAFLGKEYGIQIPNDYKIYEHLSNDAAGIYRFKFCVGKRTWYGSENFAEEENEQD